MCWWGCGEDRNFIHRKIKNRMTIWVTSGYLSKRKKIKVLERYCLSCIQNITIYSSWDMGTTYMSINRWMDKEDVLHSYSHLSQANLSDDTSQLGMRIIQLHPKGKKKKLNEGMEYSLCRRHWAMPLVVIWWFERCITLQNWKWNDSDTLRQTGLTASPASGIGLTRGWSWLIAVASSIWVALHKEN